MGDVTKADVHDLHKRIDLVIQGQNENRVIIARIETKLESTHLYPCNTLKEHLTNHRETKALWETPIVSAIISMVKMGIVAGVTWLIVKQ
uniref:Uncharacterized protein n=1 Tax=viral metagenome TaxID=1070528 RepID=A0A6M3XFN4_9ZZZZ